LNQGDKMHEILTGDCLEVLKSYPDNNFTSIITDPPYGLSFMGKKWDYDVPSVEIWKECLRVLKPGGTMLCFAGSRTQHRMAVNVEDAGFLIKDCLLWLYGSGFPKATDISKQLDKIAGAEREVIGTQPAGTGPLKTGHTEISGGGFIGEERSPMIKITAPCLKNSHPCVKPISLMKYLLKLLQPPKDGLLLDPFAGSGTTIVAAKSLGFNAIGIEKSEEYSKIAKARIAAENLPEKDLF